MTDPSLPHPSLPPDLFAGTPAMLAHANLAGTLDAVNPAWATALGSSPAALAGRPLGDLAHPDDRTAVAEQLARDAGGGGIHRFAAADGAWRTLAWRAAPTTGGAGRHLAAWDVTAQLAASDALAAELDAVVSSVSHDLRAPLRAIHGFAGVLLDDRHVDGLPDDTRQFLGLVREAGAELARLFDDLLTVTRVTREPLSPRDGVDVGALAQEVVEYVLAERQGDRAVAWVIGDLPPCRADPALLRRLLEALLDNALKFTAPHERARIELAWDATHGAYVVRDDGVGFDPALAGHAFAIFGRLPTAQPFPGSGVGLAVAARVAARHGGRLWCDATPGAGAAFWFTVGEDSI
jgi:PAS domain S-box-containing protein